MIDHFMDERKGRRRSSACSRRTAFTSCRSARATKSPAFSTCRDSGLYINGGYFIFRKEIFNYIRDGEELVEEPFRRLVERGLLAAYRHDGFWLPMDTFKDKQLLEDMYSRGVAPWEVWKNGSKLNALAKEPAASHLGSPAAAAAGSLRRYTRTAHPTC